MFDFNDVHVASKDEQIRAFAIEKASDYLLGTTSDSVKLVKTAGQIEKFIKEGTVS